MRSKNRNTAQRVLRYKNLMLVALPSRQGRFGGLGAGTILSSGLAYEYLLPGGDYSISVGNSQPSALWEPAQFGAILSRWAPFARGILSLTQVIQNSDGSVLTVYFHANDGAQSLTLGSMANGIAFTLQTGVAALGGSGSFAPLGATGLSQSTGRPQAQPGYSSQEQEERMAQDWTLSLNPFSRRNLQTDIDLVKGWLDGGTGDGDGDGQPSGFPVWLFFGLAALGAFAFFATR